MIHISWTTKMSVPNANPVDKPAIWLLVTIVKNKLAKKVTIAGMITEIINFLNDMFSPFKNQNN